jgi:arylsulfatase A-like enzyme
MTGQYPLSHGVFLNDVQLPADAVSLAEAFGGAGYQTAYIGKWHLDGRGRSNFVPPERRQGFQYWRAAECTHNYNRSHYYADEGLKRFWEGYDAFAQTEDARRYIREHREDPFALILSWGPPHAPYGTAPERLRRLYTAADIRLRGNVPKEMAQRARRDLAGYYAHCTALDECVGRVRETLAECGLEERTILVFTSDHGDMLGSRGQYKKQRPWDESIRVPLLWHWPAGLGPGGRKLSTPINTPDIMPTLLGLCGIEIPETVEGTSRAELLRGRAEDRDEAALITCPSPFGQWTRPQGGREYRGVRTARYTYVRSLAGPWLLYDNRRDPDQLDNLCDRPEHAGLQASLEAQLQQQLKATRDQFLPGSEYIQRWGYRTDRFGTVPYTP